MDTKFGFAFAVVLSFVSLPGCACSRFGSGSVVDQIPPESATITAIGETAVRIHLYMLANRVPPPDLSFLPARKGYANNTKDGWGRDLQYSIDSAGVITLMSYGANGKRGAPSTRITRSYRTRNADGTSIIDRNDWVK